MPKNNKFNWINGAGDELILDSKIPDRSTFAIHVALRVGNFARRAEQNKNDLHDTNTLRQIPHTANNCVQNRSRDGFTEIK